MVERATPRFEPNFPLPRASVSGSAREGLIVFVLLACLWSAIAAPLFTSRFYAWSDVYNYDLAVADFVTQVRAGDLHPAVGQTQYAYNGRIHPIRNAPLMFYWAALVDAATGRSLGFTLLLNVTLSLTLGFVVFGSYAALRSLGCDRLNSLLLCAVYSLSPSVLGSLYTTILLMTLHAMAILPWVVASWWRLLRRPSWWGSIVLGACVAGLWLAHPPVAAWASGALVASTVLACGWRLGWRGALYGLAVIGSFALFSASLFASVFSANSVFGIHEDGGSTAVLFSRSILPILSATWRQSLLPISRDASQLTDMQFGYAAMLVLGLCAALGAAALRREGGKRWAALAPGVVAALIVAVTLPIPGLTPFFWRHIPSPLAEITNAWPMYRTYPVALGLAVFCLCEVLSAAGPRARRRATFCLALAAALAAFDAVKFVRHGLSTRAAPEESRNVLLPGSIDLTVTSYAFLGAPKGYPYAATDPLLEFHLAKAGGERPRLEDELAQAKVGPARLLRLSGQRDAAGTISLGTTLTMEPGLHYLLTFEFEAPPLRTWLEVYGPRFFRHYPLPDGGPAGSFGMRAGDARTISVWTEERSAQPLQFRLRSLGPDLPASIDFARVTVQAFDPKALPVRVMALFPLRLETKAPGPGYAVETCRRYIPGYTASVNGEAARPQASRDGNVEVPVPPGASEVEVGYQDPVLDRAFHVSATAWAAFAVGWVVLSWRRARIAPFRSRGLRLSPGRRAGGRSPQPELGALPAPRPVAEGGASGETKGLAARRPSPRG